jgi:ligand-binding SRPBCC domain-containing protein
MSLHRLETRQKLPVTIEMAWEFLSSPENLKKITPPQMAFLIRSGFKPGDKMYAGMVISYTVKPIWGIPMNWVTEITHLQKPDYFVDEQRFGPYTFWHHKHFLNEIDGGVEMKDVIDYKLPMGVLGDFMNSILVKRQLREIFDFRYRKLEEIFGKWKNPVLVTTN